MKDKIINLIEKDEKILYSGKPSKKAFIFTNSFVMWLVPFLLFTFVLIFLLCGSYDSVYTKLTVVASFIVWLGLIFLIFMLISIKRYKNIEYIITNKSVYASDGIISHVISIKPLSELSHVNIGRNIIEQIFNVGSIELTSNRISGSSASYIISNSICIRSLKNYEEVYDLLKKLQSNVHSDIAFK